MNTTKNCFIYCTCAYGLNKRRAVFRGFESTEKFAFSDVMVNRRRNDRISFIFCW